MFVFALIGFGMKKLNLSPAIFLISFILGPLAENAIRQSLLISKGSIAIFFTRPIALGLFLLSIASIVWALRRRKAPLVDESAEIWSGLNITRGRAWLYGDITLLAFQGPPLLEQASLLRFSRFQPWYVPSAIHPAHGNQNMIVIQLA